jgi:SnoaL-like domain
VSGVASGAPSPQELAELAATVGWLRDREQIRDVALHYARSVDRHDWDGVRSCFAPGAVWAGSLGESDAASYVDLLAPGVEVYEATMHVMGNQYVDVQPGADTGSVETYAVAWHLEPAGADLDDLVMGVRYCDDVVRTADGWRISRRQVARQWYRGPFPRPTQP